MSKLELDL